MIGAVWLTEAGHGRQACSPVVPIEPAVTEAHRSVCEWCGCGLTEMGVCTGCGLTRNPVDRRGS